MMMPADAGIAFHIQETELLLLVYEMLPWKGSVKYTQMLGCLAPDKQPDKHCPALSRHWAKHTYLALDVSANIHFTLGQQKSRSGWPNRHVMALH